MDGEYSLTHPRQRARNRVSWKLHNLPRRRQDAARGARAERGGRKAGDRASNMGRPAALPPMERPRHVAQLRGGRAGLRHHPLLRRPRRLPLRNVPPLPRLRRGAKQGARSRGVSADRHGVLRPRQPVHESPARRGAGVYPATKKDLPKVQRLLRAAVA